MFDFAYRSQQTPETSWLSPDGILTLFSVDLVVCFGLAKLADFEVFNEDFTVHSEFFLLLSIWK